MRDKLSVEARDSLVKVAKEFRRDADALLQRMKAHARVLDGHLNGQYALCCPLTEAYNQHSISIRDLEGAIMRQGMVLKNINEASEEKAPPVYPTSYDPSKATVEPTADGLKL